MTNSRPYRPNVGIALFSASGRVLIGRRFRDDGPEIILPGLEWQMPFAGPSSHRLAKFRGQRQKWFALRFTGLDSEIDPLTSRNGQPPEFDQWRWERLDLVADLVVPFRRDVYRAVARHFAAFAG
jgi:putative (di)nucleoside polyphosphate hydrolase